jgi:pyruvate dehydrogenase E2 component (dihydrolipoyllysine-residue acetyltransferase)
MAVTKVVMPKLSEAMETGKIIKWLKKEGDAVQGGDILAEVETDKADVEMEAFGSGVLRKILAPAGAKAPVGALIGIIAEADEDISSLAASAPAPTAAPAAATPQPAPAGATSDRPATVPPQPRSEDHATVRPATAPTPTGTGASKEPATAGAAAAAGEPRGKGSAAAAAAPAPGRVKASPLAKKIAAQSGVDLRLIQGSGPGGRIVRKDVEAAASAPPAAATAAAPALRRVPAEGGPEFEDRPLSQIRAAIAKRMPMSKAPVPHFYVTSEVAMDRAWALREELNALEGQPKISVNDLVVRACALTLMRHPGVNASFQGEAIRVYHRAHIGIAVAMDEGLITPVLRDCEAKPLARIATESRDLAERARQRKLRVPELSGATFSISNLGMFDVAEFSAIINPPEGAILAVGSVRRVPVVDGDSVSVGRRMAMTLSCDHRVMDGAMGARFLQDLKRLLEEPLRLLV